MIQKKPSHPQMKVSTLDNTYLPTTSESKKQLGRQKHKSSIPLVKHHDDITCQLNTQDNTEPPPPSSSRLSDLESKERRGKREESKRRMGQDSRGWREPQHRTGGLSNGLSVERKLHLQETSQLGVQREAQGEVQRREGGEVGVDEEDIDTDLSDSERVPSSSLPSFSPFDSCHLQPDLPKPKGHTHDRLTDPDFLPPPFNSWSLQQLALFLHPEERHTQHSRAAGLRLDRYLRRLLQLELLQILSIQKESGTNRCSSHPESRHGRLSDPKCIPQCQRAFPLALLSSQSTSSLLTDYIGTFHSHTRHIFLPAIRQCCPHLSPLPEHPERQERPGRGSLPKRSYSESRVHSLEKILVAECKRGSCQRTEGLVCGKGPQFRVWYWF
ncbi:hypothetical protein DPEC_G00249050 [Dallia pectoralis]|uniref:Uncharacterized protein n=1 Tax=Dallia pectoralis TaxID=75939 RepID=A0ACC2FSV0_DALPE|nr:hypothetical protein DPEC_G00249050 [Dallia pectoralis]